MSGGDPGLRLNLTYLPLFRVDPTLQPHSQDQRSSSPANDQQQFAAPLRSFPTVSGAVGALVCGAVPGRIQPDLADGGVTEDSGHGSLPSTSSLGSERWLAVSGAAISGQER